MPKPVRPQPIAALVDSMFAEVFTPEERAGLLEHIEVWEAENPDVSNAQRVTGWIDVAYAFQARQRPRPAADRLPLWGVVSVYAI